NDLYDSAVSFRIPDLPAFALEYLPNRDSLVYGDLYGISAEASTIFRATLRYEGFSEIMACLGKLGFFDSTVHPKLEGVHRPTFGAFLNELLNNKSAYFLDSGKLQVPLDEHEIVKRVMMFGCCREAATATKTAKTIRFLGLHDCEEIPKACSSAFDVTCLRMQERLSYSSQEQDMVLLHHEIQVEYPDGRPTENHKATLLEFGTTENGKTTTAMARTVGVPAAIGALLLLQNKIQTKGLIRPTEPEVYVPALQMLEACGIMLLEKIETL
ncbi:alpha-aminoadipic semialdehyde synthase-like, partial [Phalaenopsis equestris]|uniref:alpha-aminoadipic semialdehyde synthase-like n=1 Tax=Phalaenopsis equestris TaxID=78828 RepID=UPI0009E1A8C7